MNNVRAVLGLYAYNLVCSSEEQYEEAHFSHHAILPPCLVHLYTPNSTKHHTCRPCSINDLAEVRSVM